MNQRENFFAMLNGEESEFAPCERLMLDLGGLATNNADQPWMGGMDPMGVNWVATREGVIPEPGKFMFDDIADWREYVHFPDVDDLHLEEVAAMETQGFKRDEKVSCIATVCGPFERMAAFMGFENALIALIEDPDECRAFLDAFADYKIRTINRIIDLYDPDMILLFDDIATARGMFMSLDTWREIIKPSVVKIGKAIQDRGVIFGLHTCGKCEAVLDDYVEIGVRYWHSAQCMNDLPGILEKYGNRLIVSGGWDSSGPASYVNSTKEEVIAETERCLREYGKYKNFVLLPILLNDQPKGTDLFVSEARMDYIIETWQKGCMHK